MPPRKKAKTATAVAEEKRRKIAKTVTVDDEDESSDNDPIAVPAAKKAKKNDEGGGAKANRTSSDLSSIDFSCPAGNAWNLKITSWNVNGIRALLEKKGLEFLKYEEPDIFCLQETKCSKEKIPVATEVDGYTTYWLSGDSEGYSGVGLYTKKKPISVQYGIGDEVHDKDGRVITAEYDKFYLVLTYVPNAGRKLVRLPYRMEWDVAFRGYLKKLDDEKPVILCGDLNVAHQEIDIANPKTNKRNAGFTNEERDGFTSLLQIGFVDTFRHLHPDVAKAYTFWTYMMNARAKNVGWRLDYFVLSKTLLSNLYDSVIRKDVFGSDHCPITLFLSI